MHLQVWYSLTKGERMTVDRFISLSQCTYRCVVLPDKKIT